MLPGETSFRPGKTEDRFLEHVVGLLAPLDEGILSDHLAGQRAQSPLEMGDQFVHGRTVPCLEAFHPDVNLRGLALRHPTPSEKNPKTSGPRAPTWAHMGLVMQRAPTRGRDERQEISVRSGGETQHRTHTCSNAIMHTTIG